MSKKEFRKEIEAKLDTVFGHMANKADKKFKKLVKKAAHILSDGLHKPEPKAGKVNKGKQPTGKAVVKKAATVKTAKKIAGKKK